MSAVYTTVWTFFIVFCIRDWSLSNIKSRLLSFVLLVGWLFSVTNTNSRCCVVYVLRHPYVVFTAIGTGIVGGANMSVLSIFGKYWDPWTFTERLFQYRFEVRLTMTLTCMKTYRQISKKNTWQTSKRMNKYSTTKIKHTRETILFLNSKTRDF